MATDPNKKTLRHFQCRDYLWETFEQMSAELECSVDYLINEAMRQYARSRSYPARTPGGGREAADPDDTGEASAPHAMPTPTTRPGPAAAAAPPQARPALPSMPGMPGMPGQRPSSPGIASSPPPGGPRIPTLPGARAPVTPAMSTGRPSLPSSAPVPGVQARPPSLPNIPPLPGRPGGGSLPSLPQGQSAPRLPPLPSAGGPPPMPASSGAPPPMPRVAPAARPAPQAQTLVAIYQGVRHPVDKDEFIIGRGQKTSDLVIRDSNVSRRHAIVTRHNNQFWIVDQQSTNGVEFNGQKVERKRIDDGDVFRICDYEILFTYQ